MQIAKIVYINLDRRKDHRAWIEEELDTMMPRWIFRELGLDMLYPI